MQFFKKVFIWAIVGAIFYVLLAYHFVVIKNSVKLLRKEELTLKYTIYSTKGKKPENILDIDPLWNAGIADLLVENGLMSKEELKAYEAKFEEDD